MGNNQEWRNGTLNGMEISGLKTKSDILSREKFWLRHNVPILTSSLHQIQGNSIETSSRKLQCSLESSTKVSHVTPGASAYWLLLDSIFQWVS